MSRDSVAEWNKSGRKGRQTKYEGRRGIITRATRLCFERKGIAKTSIADITREVDITRELFYYYFPNKDAVIVSVIEDYVDEARGLIEKYLELAENDAESLLVQVMRAFRSWLFVDAEMPVPMLAVLHEAGIQTPIMCRVADEALEALRGTAALDADVDLTDASACGLKAGLVGAMCTELCDERLTNEQLAQGLLPLFATRA